MKIIFDAKRALVNQSGLGNYSRWVITGLCDLYPQHVYTALSPSSARKSLFKLPDNCALLQPHSFFSKKLKALWRVMGWGIQSADIFHGLSNELPFGLKRKKIKSVVTIHDVIFLRYPQYYSSIDRKIYHFKFKYAVDQADRIVAISQQTKQDIIQFYKISADKIEVVYQDCNALFHQRSLLSEVMETKKKMSIEMEYILCVGTIEQRKNQLNVLRGFEKIAAQFPGLQLIFVGKSTNYQAKLEDAVVRSPFRQRIKIYNETSSEDIKHLYTGCRLAVYLSVFEGFGLPVLEALNCGATVLASNVSSMPEAGGKAALYCDPLNVQDVAEKMFQLLNDEELCASLKKEIPMHVLSFRKEQTLKQLEEIYRSL